MKNGTLNVIRADVKRGVSAKGTYKVSGNVTKNTANKSITATGELKVSKISGLSAKIKKLFGHKESGGSFYGGSWHSIPQFSGGGKLTERSLEYFAGGGSPTDGTAFVAGENGPEVVGHIGGRTEVLNASQLASTMYSAVLAAMAAAGNKSLVNVILQGDAKQFFRVMQQMAREYTAQTGKPAFE